MTPDSAFTDEDFGRNLRAARLHERLTQEQLADALSEVGFPMHQSTVAKIEAGSRSASISEVVALSGILDVPIDALVRKGDEAGPSARMDHLAAMLDVIADEAAAVSSDEERIRREANDASAQLAEAMRRLDECRAQLKRLADMRAAIVSDMAELLSDPGYSYEPQPEGSARGEHPEAP